MATGRRNGGRREAVDAVLWLTLDVELAMSSADDRDGHDNWRDLAFSRREILRLWPPIDQEAAAPAPGAPLEATMPAQQSKPNPTEIDAWVQQKWGPHFDDLPSRDNLTK